MTNALFKETGLRYEVAIDVIGAIIAYHAGTLGRESVKSQKNEEVIATAESAMTQLMDLRDQLRPNDSDAIEAVIAKYAPISRRLLQGGTANV